MQRLIEVAKMLGWSKKDGDCIGHWRDKPPGHRCLWTVRWETSRVIEPHYWCSPEDMPQPMLEAELQDIADRLPDLQSQAEAFWAASAAQLIASLKERPDDEQTLSHVRMFIHKARGSLLVYPQFLCPWDLPPKIYFRNWRPGWSPSDIQQMAMKGERQHVKSG